MYLDKVDTYAKAHPAVKADEQATVPSRMGPQPQLQHRKLLLLFSLIKRGKSLLVRQPKHMVVSIVEVMLSMAQVMVEEAT